MKVSEEDIAEERSGLWLIPLRQGCKDHEFKRRKHLTV